MRNGEDPLDLCCVFGMLVGGVLEEGMDRRQPSVPRPHGVAALALCVLQEGDDQFGGQVLEGESGRRLASPVAREHEQHSERVPVGSDRVLAGVALAAEPI